MLTWHMTGDAILEPIGLESILCIVFSHSRDDGAASKRMSVLQFCEQRL